MDHCYKIKVPDPVVKDLISKKTTKYDKKGKADSTNFTYFCDSVICMGKNHANLTTPTAEKMQIFGIQRIAISNIARVSLSF